MTRSERELKGVEGSIQEHASAADEILTEAESAKRDCSPEENEKIQEHFKAIKDLKARKDDLDSAIKVEHEARELAGKMSPEPATPKADTRAKSLGAQFIESDAYKARKEKGFSGNWSTGEVKLKALLTEGDPDGSGTSDGTGGALVGIDVRPGILPTLFSPLRVVDLFASGTTASNSIRYLVESVANSGAEVTLEGHDKPESELEFSYADESVKKIATFLPVVDEMLEDAPALRSYIDARLRLFVQQKEEESLLHGVGGDGFLGLLPRIPAANKFVVSDADAANAADHIYAALTLARRSFLEPDGIVVHPDDWSDLRLLKDGNDNYIGGSPFSNTGSNPGDSLWGKRVVVTESMIPGYGLVGAFGTAAQVFHRGGLTVEASNSHSDFFQKNKTAIRAETREALAVYRPQAFAIADLGYAS